MSSARPSVLLALLAGALATLASACTGTAPNQQVLESKSPAAAASASTRMSASPTASADPLAGMSGHQIVAKAIADTEAASFVTYTGMVPARGQFVPVWLVTAKGEGCRGTIQDSSPAGRFEIIVHGSSVWLQPDGMFWASGAGVAPSSLASVAGKYLAVSSSSKYLAALAGICALGPIFQGSGSKGDDYSSPEPAYVDGQDTRLIIDNSTIAGGMFYVTETARPLIVRFIPSGDSPVNFTYLSTAPLIAAPPAREVIDGSRYGF